MMTLEAATVKMSLACVASFHTKDKMLKIVVLKTLTLLIEKCHICMSLGVYISDSYQFNQPFIVVELSPL